jgi:hypothetical protein
MWPFYDTDITGNALSSIFGNETALRAMFEISCKPECNTNIYQSIEEFPKQCIIGDLDPEQFPDAALINYKFIGTYDVAMCNIYEAYEQTKNGESSIDFMKFNEIVLLSTTRMRVNDEQLQYQRNTFDVQDNLEIITNNAYNVLLRNIVTNTILNSKISEIVEFTCDRLCAPYNQQYKDYYNEQVYINMYETPMSCRINNVDLEPNRKYTLHFEYSEGMCKLFKLLQSDNVVKPVNATLPPENKQGMEDFEIIIVVVGVIISLAIIVAITICCIKRFEWKRQIKNVEDAVSA